MSFSHNNVIELMDREPLAPVISSNDDTDDVFLWLLNKYFLTKASMSTSAPSSLSWSVSISVSSCRRSTTAMLICDSTLRIYNTDHQLKIKHMEYVNREPIVNRDAQHFFGQILIFFGVLWPIIMFFYVQ